MRLLPIFFCLIWLHQPSLVKAQHPSLIPLPQALEWRNGSFNLPGSKAIVINDNSVKLEAALLQKNLETIGVKTSVVKSVKNKQPHIELRIDPTFTSQQYEQEAYRLNVEPHKITLTARTAHGIFNGIQTLQQLHEGKTEVPSCDITDWPSFAWRSYMVDVGRNFQSMPMLKRQIDMMAKYKLNVFHFHPTEDIAWRFYIKRYPQLTAAETMTRNKGQFYSEQDIKELIAYCEARHITFVPEIDMPGHSKAFTRAMKTDMQTDSGIAIVKNILTEIAKTYKVDYIHIGADEVKITNQRFIPEVTAHIQALGKKVVGWEPGGNFTANTIRQLWMDDATRIVADSSVQYIDSRHLYINHMDPLESVVTIFNRRISDLDKGSHRALGATLCTWNDRAVTHEEDIERMNPVYPSIITFAERIWRGGGHSGWKATIGTANSERAKEFSEFEQRLLDQQKQLSADFPFPYRKQSAMTWKLYGPFENQGNLDASFAPETNQLDQLSSMKEVIGGTIVWRHWWAPLIEGVLDAPKENTTWYASTSIWSDEDKEQPVWIGFNNISRSMATDSPPVGSWDTRQSKVWVNGVLVDAPNWGRGGQKGDSEIPLVDESYEYRAPAKVKLKKGWNTVLVKSPIGKFAGKDWQNPQKWIFTFVPY